MSKQEPTFEQAIESAAVRIVIACEPGFDRTKERKQDRDYVMAEYEKLKNTGKYSYSECAMMARVEFAKKILAELTS